MKETVNNSLSSLATLSSRKQAVARYIAQGFSDKQIAAMIDRSEDTVAYHISGSARIWGLDPARNTRVQIAQRVLLAA